MPTFDGHKFEKVPEAFLNALAWAEKLPNKGERFEHYCNILNGVKYLIEDPKGIDPDVDRWLEEFEQIRDLANTMIDEELGIPRQLGR